MSDQNDQNDQFDGLEMAHAFQRDMEVWEIIRTLAAGNGLLTIMEGEQRFLDTASAAEQDRYAQEKRDVVEALRQDTRALLAFAQAAMDSDSEYGAYWRAEISAVEARTDIPDVVRQAMIYESQAFLITLLSRDLATQRAVAIRTIRRAGARYPWLLELLERFGAQEAHEEPAARNEGGDDE